MCYCLCYNVLCVTMFVRMFMYMLHRSYVCYNVLYHYNTLLQSVTKCHYIHFNMLQCFSPGSQGVPRVVLGFRAPIRTLLERSELQPTPQCSGRIHRYVTHLSVLCFGSWSATQRAGRGGQPQYSGITLDWFKLAGWRIDPVPEASYIPKFISLAQIVHNPG